MKHKPDTRTTLPLSERYFIWGIIFFVASLAASLSAYYLYSPIGRQFAFSLLIFSLMTLFWAMAKDLESVFTYKWVAGGVVLALVSVYFLQRMELPRFDFMVGDASDYFAAGLCSVTYNQDIGYILPLSATITALGYEIFGIENVLLSYVILYATSIPIFYFIFRKLQLTSILSFLMSVFLVFIPLSLWFSKTSFTEPIWQILLFVFVLNMYMILQKNTINWKNLISIYMILFLAPMLRVEGVFYYGLLSFLVLYHFWQYQNIRVSLLLSFGIFIIAVSTHITLRLRPDYMLNRQFNRIIPHATEESVMLALYALAGIFIGLVILIYFLRKWYTKMPFSVSIVILSFIVKIAIAYIYATKKHMTFLDMLYINEYDFAVGNFGIPIALLMILGLVILYAKAFKGDVFSLLLVVVYTVFYLPFSMQAVTFTDPHAFFFYWNRYYFSILMMIHLFGLGLIYQFIYKYLQNLFTDKRIQLFSIAIIIIVVSFLSMNIKLYHIVVQESYLKGTYKLYERIKKDVGQTGIYIVTEDGVVYKQNTRPDGLEKIEYLIGRMFSLYKIPERGHEVIPSKKLYPRLEYQLPKKNVDYILCAGRKTCHLDNEQLTLVDTFDIPLEWREHFGLDKNASSIHKGDIAKSVVQKVNLKFSLYKVGKKFSVGKKASFKANTVVSSQLLSKGWTFINNRSSAFSSKGKGVVLIPRIQKLTGETYSLGLRYAIINASAEREKSVTFKLAGKVLQTVKVNSHTTRDIDLLLPNELLPSQPEDIEITIESSNEGQIMLRSILIKKKGK